MKMGKVFCAAAAGILLSVFATHALAQQPASPTLAIHAGRLIDVRTGQVSNGAYIIVAKDRILRARRRRID